MAVSHALLAPASPSRGLPLPGFGDVAFLLVRGGALLNLGALAIFLTLRWRGSLDLDAVTLLPAVACAGAAAASLGMVLVCLRALRAA